VALLACCLASYAQDDPQESGQKYEGMLAQFNHGMRAPDFLRNFALEAHSLKHDDVANKAVNEYLHGLSQDALYTKPNLEFLTDVTDIPTDAGFNLFYRNTAKVDGVLGEGAAERLIDGAIELAEIYPIYLKGGQGPDATEPDWNAIQAAVARKYDESSSTRIVLEMRTQWYFVVNRWPEFTASILSWVQKYGAPDSRWDMNTVSSAIGVNISDKAQLMATAVWIQTVLNQKPDNLDNSVLMDDYANILYKLGKTDEAIQWENKAIDLDKVMIAKYGGEIVDILPHYTYPDELKNHQRMLAKMKLGEPTWTTE
jgi:tetratricopeptide (TPR) repeat protein